MHLCPGCGFDSVSDGEPCRLCGADSSAATVVDPDSIEVTVPGGQARVPADAAAGHLYAGRYRIETMIGRGGMGSVYEVTDARNGERAALKILHRAATRDESGLARFKREVAILSKIRHPAVPRVLDWGVVSGELYFVAELIRGSDLRMHIRAGMTPARAAEVAAEVADALAVAHEHGVIHRDVKPHNIMITDDGAVRLLDFGIARGAGIDMKTITATGVLVGTPEYMSPEQFETNRVDVRSDVYSLGVVLFEMLTGMRPFTGDSPISIAVRHKMDPPPSPRTIRRDVPMWLERIVLRCMEKDPARRYQSAADLARELRRPRSAAAATRRRLPNGDWVIEDDSEAGDWALVLSSAKAKPGWTPGRPVGVGQRFYRLESGEEDPATRRWVYRFSAWPEEEILRGLIEYDETAAEPPGKVEGLKGRIKDLLR